MTEFALLAPEAREGWAMSGQGGFEWLSEGVVESAGGPGLWWYRAQSFRDFEMDVEWRVLDLSANSGVFLRFPPLDRADPDGWRVAVARGYEVQIDERGVDPETGLLDQPLHLTGAIYRLAPAERRTSHPVGRWNRFHIRAEGLRITVELNGVAVSRLARDLGRPREGHVGLQAHHEGSRVQFRHLRLRPLSSV